MQFGSAGTDKMIFDDYSPSADHSVKELRSKTLTPFVQGCEFCVKGSARQETRATNRTGALREEKGEAREARRERRGEKGEGSSAGKGRREALRSLAKPRKALQSAQRKPTKRKPRKASQGLAKPRKRRLPRRSYGASTRLHTIHTTRYFAGHRVASSEP